MNKYNKIGLSDKQVKEAREKYGSNKITGEKHNSFISLFIESLGDPIIKIFQNSTAANKWLYDCKMPGARIVFQQENMDLFNSFTTEEQLSILYQMISYLKTNRTGTCDVSLLKDKAKAIGDLRLSANLSNWNYTDVRIVDQSASGLFESKSINLKELL